MFDPNNNKSDCEAYLSNHLGCPVEIINAEQLPKSTREPPWRLVVKAGGVRCSYILQIGSALLEYEYRVLKAIENTSIPTPKAYGLDLSGEFIGETCFFRDFIEGQPITEPILAGEHWAEKLYLDAVLTLQAIEEDELGMMAQDLKREPIELVLESAYEYLVGKSISLVDKVYQVLKENKPGTPAVRFSNGDLWLDNFIVRGQELAAVIDFQNACFSDPIYEFLLSFFIKPELQGRGIERKFCERHGVDPDVLHWYHGLEYFDTLRWVLLTGEGFEQHTPQSLEQDMRNWLEDGAKL